MNKTSIPSSLLAILCLVSTLFCCKDKDQFFMAKVVDFKTGLPIDSASLNYSVSYVEHSLGSMRTVFTDYRARTDAKGEYSFSIDPDESYTVTHIGKTGYKYDCCLSLDNPIQLMPLDCTLRLRVKNELGIHDSLYLTMSTKAFSHYSLSGGVTALLKYPIVLIQGESYVQSFDLASDYFTYLYWDKKEFKNTTYSQFLKDSIYLNKGDTIDYMINY